MTGGECGGYAVGMMNTNHMVPAPGVPSVRAAWFDEMAALYAACHAARAAYCADRTAERGRALTAAECAVRDHARSHPSCYPLAFAEWASANFG